jgi:cytochrome c oxidase subunit 2
MWQDFPLFPESASSLSDGVDALYFFLIAISAFFSALICALVVGFSFRYRRRSKGERGAAIEGSLALELVWSLIPLGLTMVIFVWGAKVYFAAAVPPADVTDIYVVGKQWMWKLQHPDGQREINDLHVPVGQAVRLTMTSEDVIHSFFVPAFRMKQDVLPGRYTRAWFRATKPGEYHLFCAEYCGTKHSEMIGKVYVLEPQEYERWLSGALAGEPPAETGRKLFESLRCDTCHPVGPGAEVAGAPNLLRGPSLVGIFGTQVALADGGTALVNEEYVRESILRPMQRVTKGFEPVMPSFEGQLGEEQVLQIIAYLKTLKGVPAGGSER